MEVDAAGWLRCEPEFGNTGLGGVMNLAEIESHLGWLDLNPWPSSDGRLKPIYLVCGARELTGGSLPGRLSR